MKKIFVFAVLFCLLFLSVVIGTREVALCENGVVTHRLDMSYQNVTVIAVKTQGVFGRSEWLEIKNDIVDSYKGENHLIVCRDAEVYHRVKRILNSDVDERYISETIDMAICRNG